MEKLALLLLALSLAACAISAPSTQQAAYVPINSLIARPYSQGPISAPTLKRIAEAQAYCRADTLGPSDKHYGPCVNDYLQDRYGLAVFVDSAGTLRVGAGNRAPTPTVQFGTPPYQ